MRQAEAHAQKSSSAPKEVDDTEIEPPKDGSSPAELVLSDSDDDHARKRLLKLKGLSDISGNTMLDSRMPTTRFKKGE